MPDEAKSFSGFFCENFMGNGSVALRNGFVAAIPVKTEPHREHKARFEDSLFSGLF
ncbi:MAG: hypothetical protein FWH27_11240 [Planctomycetaceae bacterium]|nr:hypothetical protein [Planctomycetaceae bacterium]